jgi:hypothetical protein
MNTGVAAIIKAMASISKRKSGLRRILGFVLLVSGAWGLIAPQANLGLTELRWMSRYAFPGEAFVGIVFLGLAYYLLGRVPPRRASAEESISR